MRRLMCAALAALAAFATIEAQALTLQEAMAQVEAAANSPETLAEIMAQLSPSDQETFLAEVIEAIAEMPVSEEEKQQKVVAATIAAVNAAPANRDALLAVAYARAPLGAVATLTRTLGPALAEALADPSGTRTEAEQQKIAESAQASLATINASTAKASDADKRTAAAITMYALADSSLTSTLVAGATLTSTSADQVSSWVDASVSLGNYTWLTGAADTGTIGVIGTTVFVTSEVFSDYSSTTTAEDTYTIKLLDATTYAMPQEATGSGVDRTPRTLDETVPWYSGYDRSEATEEAEKAEEAEGYAGQATT